MLLSSVPPVTVPIAPALPAGDLSPLTSPDVVMVDEILAEHERQCRAVSRVVGPTYDKAPIRAWLHESWRQTRSIRHQLRGGDFGGGRAA